MMCTFKDSSRNILRSILFFIFLAAGLMPYANSQDKVEVVNAKLITIKDCKACSTELTEELLYRTFKGLVFEEIDYREKQAQDLIEALEIRTLPIFIFDSDIVKRENFSKVSKSFTKKSSYYILKPRFSGIFYYLDRPEIPEKIDLFIDVYGKESLTVLENLKVLVEKKGLDLDMHFIFDKDSKSEVEECSRLLSVKRLYPGKFWDYLFKRLKDIDSSYWNLPLEQLGIDVKKVIDFSLSQQARKLLGENASLAKELEITSSPVILINNKRIFGIVSGAEGSLEEFLDGTQ